MSKATLNHKLKNWKRYQVLIKKNYDNRVPPLIPRSATPNHVVPRFLRAVKVNLHSEGTINVAGAI